jgi:hypothetical protein
MPRASSLDSPKALPIWSIRFLPKDSTLTDRSNGLRDEPERLAQLAHGAKTTKDAYGRGRGPNPSVIARLVSKAVKTRKPHPRYVAGKYAKPMINIRKWFGDRLFDRVIMSQMG